MFSFGKKSTDKTSDRDQRAKRRAEVRSKGNQKEISSGGLPEPILVEDPSGTSSPSEGGESLPDFGFLDLATTLPSRRDTRPVGARRSEGTVSSGTLDRPTRSRPNVVTVRARERRTPTASPERPRRSVDSLVQQFSPRTVVTGSLNRLAAPTLTLTPQISGPVAPVVTPGSVMGSTKLHYSKFYGRKQDADDWMTEFLDTAVTNKEDAPVELLRIFPGLMKEDAMHWYHNDLTAATRADWNLLRTAFVHAFRKEKSMSRIMARLRSIRMKDRESTRSFARRVRILLDKINPPPSAEMQAEYFIGGLPRAMNKFVRQHDPLTISEAIRWSQKFVDVEQSQEKELRKEEFAEARRSKKKKGKARSHGRKYVTSTEESEVDTSEGESDTSPSTTSKSSSDSEGPRRPRKREKQKTSRKKEREAKPKRSFQRTIDDLAGKFDKLAVNLAENRVRRRTVPLQRPGVWCTLCKKRGHYPAECPEDARYLEEDEEEIQEVYWTDEMEDVQWRMVQANPLPPAQVPRILGARFQGIGRGTGPMGTKPIQRPPMEPPGGYPDPGKSRVKGTCYNCGDPRHYSPSCPWPRAPRPVPVLCGNCGAVGHTPLECPNPAQPKMLVKYVREPDPQAEAAVRLIYMEEATTEEVNQCQTVEFMEGEVFRTSTRSMKKRDYQDLRKEMTRRKSKPRKQQSEDQPGGKQREGIPTELDPAYDRNNPKYFLKDISAEVKDMLGKEQEEKDPKGTAVRPRPGAMADSQERLKPPIAVSNRHPQSQSTPKTVKFEGVRIDGNQGYDVLRDVSAAKANVTIGELLRDNSLYRRQIRPLVTGRKRKYKLPSTAVSNVTTGGEDLGPPDIEVQVAGCLIRRVPVDGGSGVNIMIADTARALGFVNFEPTPKVLRMADQSRVIPVGKLPNLAVVIGDKPFRLDFIVIDPPTPSTYPMLLGRPWLYQAKVRTSWGRKTFTFGSPQTSITWETTKHEGETSSSDQGYTSEDSSSTIDSRWIAEETIGDQDEGDWNISVLYEPNQLPGQQQTAVSPQFLTPLIAVSNRDPAAIAVSNRDSTVIAVSEGHPMQPGAVSNRDSKAIAVSQIAHIDPAKHPEQDPTTPGEDVSMEEIPVGSKELK